MYIPYIAHDTQRSIYTQNHATASLIPYQAFRVGSGNKTTASWEKSRSLESANDAKTSEQSMFGEIHINHEFGTP